MVGYDDLDQNFPDLYERYSKYDIVQTKEDGWLELKLTQNRHQGSKLNNNYCLRVPGQKRYVSALPRLCSDFHKDMIFNNKVFYLLSIGKSSTEVAHQMKLVSKDPITGEKTVNLAPITARDRNKCSYEVSLVS